jgi:hypothetical protein
MMQPLQNFIYKHTIGLENVRRNKKKEELTLLLKHPKTSAKSAVEIATTNI